MPKPLKLLVADDDPVSRRLIAGCLADEADFELILAEDGQQAVELFREHSPDLILSDWVMPELDGLQLLNYVRSHPEQGTPYFILLTVRWRAEDRVKGLDGGADDYLIKPFEIDELKARLRAGARVLRLQRKLEEKAAILEADLRAAQSAQEGTLPRVLPKVEGVQFAYRFRPCHFVSGDSLNVFRLTEETVAFFMLDVCGHGVRAVMQSVGLHRLLSPDLGLNTPLKTALPEEPFFRISQPSEVFQVLNQEAFQHVERDFFTFFYALYEPATRRLRYSRAGHLPPYLIRAGEQPRLLEEGGMPIGIAPEPEWSDGELVLEPGDRLLVYSDGAVEIRDEAGNFLGVDGLADLLESDLPLEQWLIDLEQTVQDFTPEPLRDDLSLLALEVSTLQAEPGTGKPEKDLSCQAV